VGVDPGAVRRPRGGVRNNLPLSLRAHVLAVQPGRQRVLLFILITSNPFLAHRQPADRGPRPQSVLQDIGLAVHPPMLYLGYVGFLDFVFVRRRGPDRSRIDAGMGAVGCAMDRWWRGYSSRSASRWAPIGPLRTRWGGWWFWIRSRNASLMPWLAAPRCCIPPS